MERIAYDAFSWAVETAYKGDDGSVVTELEPFIGPDGQVRNGDGSPYKEREDDGREVVQRTLILTVAAIANGPGGMQLAIPVKEYRFGFAIAGGGALPAYERLAISMRGEKPPAQVVTAPASALNGGVPLGAVPPGVLPPGLMDRMRGRP